MLSRDASPQPSYRGAALLKLTSGSTGLPKAVLTTEVQLLADTEQIVSAMGITAADVQLAAIPLSHAYGFGNLVMPLLLQGTPIVLRESFLPHAAVCGRPPVWSAGVSRRAVHVSALPRASPRRRLAADTHAARIGGRPPGGPRPSGASTSVLD